MLSLTDAGHGEQSAWEATWNILNALRPGKSFISQEYEKPKLADRLTFWSGRH